MNRVLFSLIMILCALTGLRTIAYAGPEPPKDLESVVATWMAQANVPGLALARIEAGKVAWVRVYGHASKDRPITPRTPFNVASLTKPIFGILVLHLVAESKLDLDAPLARYWVDPDLAEDPRAQKITARMALSHQTGLPNWRAGNKLAFQFDPGQGTDYSGEGYEFLRRAIEKATQKSLPELMKTIQKKADMPAGSFGWSATLEDRIATGYNEEGKAFVMDYLKDRGPAAASSLFCSIEDYAHFTAWVSRGADLPKSLFAMMQQDQAMHDRSIDHFGLGWRIVPADGATILAHDGREDGVRTQVFVNPEEKSGFVFLTNSSNGELLTRPLTMAAMPRGMAILESMDANTWLFASSIPIKIQPRMLSFISKSPSFVSKILYSAEISLIRNHFPADHQQVEIHQAIDRIALALLNKKLTSEQVVTFLKTMGKPIEDGFQLASSFSPEEAGQWRSGLLSLAQ